MGVISEVMDLYVTVWYHVLAGFKMRFFYSVAFRLVFKLPEECFEPGEKRK